MFTGHSSGAAIASLLYAHVTAASDSALSTVCREFGAVHCVVFGSPPISVCPLQEQRSGGEHGQHSLFLSVLNEDDPIVDADVGALARRYARPILAWPSAHRRRPPSSILAAPQCSPAFVLSGTVLSIGVGPDGLLRLGTQGCHVAELRRSASLTWTAHKAVVYQERIASLYALLERDGRPNGGARNVHHTTADKHASRGALLRTQASWTAMQRAWVLQLVAACIWLAVHICTSSSA